MNCVAFTAWLDDGMPQDAAPAARAHAAGCARCARELAAMEALEHAFAGAPPVHAPAGFTGAVMRRVADTAARHDAPVAESAMPWWVMVAAQPATALACVLGGLLAWRGDALATLATAWFWRASTLFTGVLAPGSMWSDLALQLGVAFAILPLLAWLSWRLYTLSERIVMPRMLKLR